MFCRGTNSTKMEINILNNETNGFQNYYYDVEGLSISEEDEVIITSHCSYIVTNIKYIDNKNYVSLLFN